LPDFYTPVGDHRSVSVAGTRPRRNKIGRLELVIESDMTIPRDLDHVTVMAAQDGRASLQVDQDLGPGALLIPAAFDIKATASSSAVTIKAVACRRRQSRMQEPTMLLGT
jgi:hypothetical protein